jgi:hypothetical protein
MAQSIQNPNEHTSQWYTIELEGRMISSAVALFVFALKHWTDLSWPVGILVLSMSVDLIRAA